MKMTPETILQSRITAALMALLCLLPGFIGCGGDDSPAAPSSTPVILCPGDTIAAYGRVNDWPWISADLLHEEICALADNGWRGYLIEMGGSARLGKVSEEAAKSAIGERYPLLVQWCAEEGLTIAVEAIQRLKEVKGLAGFHIMAIEWEEKVPEIVERAGLYPRPVIQ